MNTKSKCGRPKFIPVIPKGNFTMKQLCEANGVDVTGTPYNKKTNPDGNRNWGKGESCIRLTLVKWKDRQLGNRRSGLIRELDETRPADGGLGAPQILFCARDNSACGIMAAKAARAAFEAERAARTPAKASKTRKARKVKAAPVAKAKRKYTRKATVAAPVVAGDLSAGTQTYEAIKAILATPEPTPVLVPVVPTPEPVTAPVTVPVVDVAPAPVTPAPETPAPAVETPAAPVAPVAA